MKTILLGICFLIYIVCIEIKFLIRAHTSGNFKMCPSDSSEDVKLLSEWYSCSVLPQLVRSKTITLGICFLIYIYCMHCHKVFNKNTYFMKFQNVSPIDSSENVKLLSEWYSCGILTQLVRSETLFH